MVPVEIHSEPQGREDAIIEVAAKAFAPVEGPDNAARIALLVRDLLDKTPAEDRVIMVAETTDGPIGLCGFSRLRYAGDTRTAFVMGPVAVAETHQRQGVGRVLIEDGLRKMRAMGVDVILVYGDPDYYGAFGFEPVSEAFAPAPYPLQHPHGWQARFLSDASRTPLAGDATCVPAFADPELW